MHVRGVHLGSFYNVNQPDANPAFYNAALILCTIHGAMRDTRICTARLSRRDCFPGTVFGVIPNIRTFPFGVDFEADSKWDSQWDGLLVNFNKRLTHHVGWGLSYTLSKGIDDGPNPSFVLIPQDYLLL